MDRETLKVIWPRLDKRAVNRTRQLIGYQVTAQVFWEYYVRVISRRCALTTLLVAGIGMDRARRLCDVEETTQCYVR